MTSVAAPTRKLPILQLAVVALVVLIAAALLFRGVDLGALTERGLAIIRNLGAVVFFGAMTVLPAFGVPLLAFTIPAGEAFAPQFGIGGVIAISLVAVGINLAFGYWVSRYALRPIIAGLMKRYGYGVPRVTRENALMVTLLVRLTPGPPYCVQACVLGLAEVPFRLYMVISWIAMIPWVVGAIVLGKGVFSGRFEMVIGGVGVLIVAAVIVHWLRRKYSRRPEATASASATTAGKETMARNIGS